MQVSDAIIMFSYRTVLTYDTVSADVGQFFCIAATNG